MTPLEVRMARTLWPVLLASAVGLLPFTVFSTFLVPIARDAGTGVAEVGALRGLGGLAALAVGTALAPLIDRVPKMAAAALAMLGVASVFGAMGDFLSLAAFCLLVGAATAVLNPALTATAADRFADGAQAGRAATLVTATQSLTAMLAAPVVAMPALLWGWRGDLVAVAVISLLLAVFFVRRDSTAIAHRERIGYLASFSALLGAVPGAVPLVLVSGLRTAAFMGYLSYLAVFYDERFHLAPGPFALVWTLSGASFFLGNLFAGRSVTPERMLPAGLAVALVSVVGIYFTGTLPVALLMTALLGASHATVAACVVSLIVRRSGDLRGTALGLNAAAMSLGVFAGAALGGVGLSLGGYPGMAVVFGLLLLLALGIALSCGRPARA